MKKRQRKKALKGKGYKVSNPFGCGYNPDYIRWYVYEWMRNMKSSETGRRITAKRWRRNVLYFLGVIV